MKIYIFVLICLAEILLNKNALADDCPKGVDSCGICGGGCQWQKTGTSLMVIGTGNATMQNYTVKENATTAPWGTDVTSVHFTGIKNIGSFAFYGGQLTSVVIPNSVTRIEAGAFLSNRLTSIEIPESVTFIGGSAFRGNDLTSVVIPKSVTNIKGLAFFNNPNLSSVVIEGTPEIDSQAFDGIATDAVIYCLTGHDSCEDKGINNIIYYEKEGNIYKIQDKTDPNIYTYYASPVLMSKGTSCTDKEQCEKILENNGKSFIVKGKFYASIADWENGIFEKKRIYTVEEAAALVKPKNNTFSIRYR